MIVAYHYFVAVLTRLIGYTKSEAPIIFFVHDLTVAVVPLRCLIRRAVLGPPFERLLNVRLSPIWHSPRFWLKKPWLTLGCQNVGLDKRIVAVDLKPFLFLLLR